MDKVNLIKPPSKLKNLISIILFMAFLILSGYKTGASFPKLISGFPEMEKLLRQMFPPDWSYFMVIVSPMLETIRMAIVGTTFGGVLAVPVALFSARNVTKASVLYYPSRLILNLVRTIPDLLFAAVFVAVFGIGPMAGILALSFFSFGLIAKLTYESIEAIDPGPLEAMTAVGANKIQWIYFAVVPQVLPQYMAYLLYTFEINIRAAAVLGLVGAGGIGLYLDRTLNWLKYDQTSSIILFTLIVVLLIDFISIRVRERLL